MRERNKKKTAEKWKPSVKVFIEREFNFVVVKCVLTLSQNRTQQNTLSTRAGGPKFCAAAAAGGSCGKVGPFN